MTDWKPYWRPGKQDRKYDVDCSVIIPFADEGANVIFTTQAIIEELEGFCKYEVILVDNMSHDHLVCKAGDREYELYSRNFFHHPLKGVEGEALKDPKNWAGISTYFFRKGIVRYFTYDEKGSHWNAKNVGIQNSRGRYLFFLDAHCIMKRDSVRKMIQFLRDTEGKKFPMGDSGVEMYVGGVHPYINYILDSRCLEYKPQRKTMGYQFCTHQMEEYYEDGVRKLRFPTKPYQVCVMSTCGMMCPRDVLDELGWWDPELGWYGGGESLANWKQSTCGYGHWIHPEAWCWHHADKRGYSWNWSDFTRNSMIAAYVVGGDAFLQDQVDLRAHKADINHLNMLADDVRQKCREHREFIASRQIMDFDTYIDYWEKHPGCWK